MRTRTHLTLWGRQVARPLASQRYRWRLWRWRHILLRSKLSRCANNQSVEEYVSLYRHTHLETVIEESIFGKPGWGNFSADAAEQGPMYLLGVW